MPAATTKLEQAREAWAAIEKPVTEATFVAWYCKTHNKKRGKKRKETRTMRKDDRGVLKLTLDDPLLPLFEQWDAGGHPNVRTSGASGVALVLRRGK